MVIVLSIVGVIVSSAAIGFSFGKVSGLVKGFRMGTRKGVAYVLTVIFSALKKEARSHRRGGVRLAGGGIVEAERHKPGNAAAMREARK